jgi:xylulokinase
MEYILAHDVGTGGNKAVLTDRDGRIICSETQEYGIHHPYPGWAEQNPESWWEAIVKTTREVLRKSEIHPSKIIGVSFSSQMLGVLPVDRNGRPLRPCIIWLDSRAGEQASQVIKMFTATLLRKLYGVLPSGKDVIPKILWIKQKEPDIFERTYKFLDCKDWIIHKFTKEFCTDWSCASVTGLFDTKKREWSKIFPGILGLPTEKFCMAVPSTEIVGEVKKDAAEETGLLDGTPVICGAGDAAASAIGSGAVLDSQANLCIGSSAWVEVTVEEHTVIKKGGIGTICSADSGKWILIAEMESAGSCLKWLGEELCEREKVLSQQRGESIYRIFDEVAERIPPGSSNLIFTPWMFGERAPIWDEYVRGGFFNLSLEHKREHMIRAVMEGVAYHTAWMLEAIEDKIKVKSINATGGGAKSRVWLQIFSDVMRRKIAQIENPLDGCSVGAALIASVGLGFHPNFESLEGKIKVAEEFIPSESRYEVLYSSFKKIYRNLSEIYRELNR